MRLLANWKRLLDACEFMGGKDPREYGGPRHRALAIDNVLPVDDAKMMFSRVEAAYRAGEMAEDLAAQVLAIVIPFVIATSEWVRDQSPVFTLTDDFFHSATVTDFEPTSPDALKMPFPALMIGLPRNRILGGQKIFIHEALVLEGRARIQANYGDVNLTWLASTPRGELFNKKASEFGVVGQYDLTQEEYLVRRVAANTLAYIEASGGLPLVKYRHGDPPAPIEREATQPRFRVGRPIKLEPHIRHLLTEGASGVHWKLGHRFIVRGHWRNQACGPELKEHKRMWIQPHWKGPKDVTEAIERAYVVK